MINTQVDTYTHIQPEQESYTEFHSAFTKEYENFKDQHIVLDLLKYNSASVEDLLGFLEISNHHIDSKHSFVIVNSSVSIDDIPDELMVVPTLQEALDVIEMEAIERDLGF